MPYKFGIISCMGTKLGQGGAKTEGILRTRCWGEYVELRGKK